MKNIFLIAALVVVGCGNADLFQPVAETEGSTAVQATTPAASTAPGQPIEPPARRCVVDHELTSSRWDCQTVNALEIVRLTVTNFDGSAPWTTGVPRVIAAMRNTTGQFLNYPSLQVSASVPSLTPAYARDSLYGMFGCTEVGMAMHFKGTAAKGTPVTFTAIPAHINGDGCALSRPPVTITVTAP